MQITPSPCHHTGLSFEVIQMLQLYVNSARVLLWNHFYTLSVFVKTPLENTMPSLGVAVQCYVHTKCF